MLDARQQPVRSGTYPVAACIVTELQAYDLLVQSVQEARKLGQVQAALAIRPEEGLDDARPLLSPAHALSSGSGRGMYNLMRCMR